MSYNLKMNEASYLKYKYTIVKKAFEMFNTKSFNVCKNK